MFGDVPQAPSDSVCRSLRAPVNFDLFAAGSALDVAAPMIFAVAAESPRDRFGGEPPTAAHRPAAGRTWVVL